jgi:hypothetical protein
MSTIARLLHGMLGLAGGCAIAGGIFFLIMIHFPSPTSDNPGGAIVAYVLGLVMIVIGPVLLGIWAALRGPVRRYHERATQRFLESNRIPVAIASERD